MSDTISIINAGYPKDGTPESHEHWKKVRANLPPFNFPPAPPSREDILQGQLNAANEEIARLRKGGWPEPKFVPMGETGQRLNPDRIEYAYEYIKLNMVYGEIIQVVAKLIPELTEERILSILRAEWGKDV